MILIVALTGAIGFLTSVLLLYTGLEAMWLRYPLAVAAAYGAFLFFLWCWLRLRWDFDLSVDGPGGGTSEPPLPWEGGGGQFGGGGASGSFDAAPAENLNSLDAGSSLTSGSGSDSPASGSGFDIDLDDFVIVLVAIAALSAAVIAAVWIIWIAPAFLAELTLDAALASGLYRKLRHVQGEHWLRTATGRTIAPVLAVGVLFSIAGYGAQLYAPHAKSVGHVIKQMREGPPPK